MVIAGRDENDTKEVIAVFFSPLESIAYAHTHAEEAARWGDRPGKPRRVWIAGRQFTRTTR